MDRRERIDSLIDAIFAALPSWQAGIWTALPAIVQSFDPEQMTVTVQPAIQGQLRAPNGTVSWQALPLLLDVPVYFPQGGDFVLTFPIAAGDECLVVFSSRCPDAWWQSGGIQVQAELRMHDLSDGFAFVGFRSQPRVLDGVSSNSTQLRSVDGTTFVEVKAGQVVNVVAPGAINLTTAGTITMSAAAMQVNLSGTMTVDAPLLRTRQDIIDRYPINAHTMGSSFAHIQEIYDEHTHGGVVTGGDDTEVPDPLLDWWP